MKAKKGNGQSPVAHGAVSHQQNRQTSRGKGELSRAKQRSESSEAVRAGEGEGKLVKEGASKASKRRDRCE